MKQTKETERRKIETNPDLDMTTIDRSRSDWGKDSQISEFWIAGCGERKWRRKNGGEN